MSLPVEPPPYSTPLASRFEQTLLAGVPVAKHAELVTMLRSSDRVVREVALLLIQLDREDAAWRSAQRATRRAARQRPQGVAQGW